MVQVLPHKIDRGTYSHLEHDALRSRRNVNFRGWLGLEKRPPVIRDCRKSAAPPGFASVRAYRWSSCSLVDTSDGLVKISLLFLWFFQAGPDSRKLFIEMCFMATNSRGAKYVYLFGSKKTDGDGTMKPLLGGKGANLAEMTRIGLPVPPGFTVTTEVCTYYYENKRSYPKELEAQARNGVGFLEKSLGKKFG